MTSRFSSSEKKGVYLGKIGGRQGWLITEGGARCLSAKRAIEGPRRQLVVVDLTAAPLTFPEQRLVSTGQKIIKPATQG